MEALELDIARQLESYRGRTVLVTGHTGFKGSWLILWLTMLGAKVIGYALDPTTPQDNFVLCGLHEKVTDIRADIRNAELLKRVFHLYQPEIAFHLAAQPIVRRSYRIPDETFEVNTMGTVNFLEAVRASESVCAAVVVTTDKCYANREQLWGYREDDRMGGYDPYSASKACAELVTAAYRHSFFTPESGKSVATARAGNVIGGGDWSEDRLIPDCIRAIKAGKPIEIRNPAAVRPWQFVLEPLYGYLLLGAKLLQGDSSFSGAWNFGPDLDSVVPVKTVVEQLAESWGGNPEVHFGKPDDLHEASLLSLDCTKAKMLLGWKPRLTLRRALEYTSEWYQKEDGTDFEALCKKQIAQYCGS